MNVAMNNPVPRVEDRRFTGEHWRTMSQPEAGCGAYNAWQSPGLSKEAFRQGNNRSLPLVWCGVSVNGDGPVCFFCPFSKENARNFRDSALAVESCPCFLFSGGFIVVGMGCLYLGARVRRRGRHSR